MTLQYIVAFPKLWVIYLESKGQSINKDFCGGVVGGVGRWNAFKELFVNQKWILFELSSETRFLKFPLFSHHPLHKEYQILPSILPPAHIFPTLLFFQTYYQIL